MIELGQLEDHHDEFARHNARVIAVSLEDEKDAQATQKDFPHLVVVADKEGGLANALQVMHPEAGPDGDDTIAPTTLLIDGSGSVRWTFRPDTFFRRLSPAEIVEAIDKHMGGGTS